MVVVVVVVVIVVAAAAAAAAAAAVDDDDFIKATWASVKRRYVVCAVLVNVAYLCW